MTYIITKKNTIKRDTEQIIQILKSADKAIKQLYFTDSGRKNGQ